MALPLDDYPSSTTSGPTGRRATTPRGTWPGSRSPSATPSHMLAAISYYRAMYEPALQAPELADEQAADPAAHAQAHPVPARARRRLHAALRPSARSAGLPGRGFRDGDRRRRRPLPAPRAARGGQRRILASSPPDGGRPRLAAPPRPARGPGVLPPDQRAKPSATRCARHPLRPGPRSSGQPQAAASAGGRPGRGRSASTRRPRPWRSDPANGPGRVDDRPARHGSGRPTPPAPPGAEPPQRAAAQRGSRPCTRWRPGRAWPGSRPTPGRRGTRRSRQGLTPRPRSGAGPPRSGPAPAPRWCRPRPRRLEGEGQRPPGPCTARRPGRASRAAQSAGTAPPWSPDHGDGGAGAGSRPAGCSPAPPRPGPPRPAGAAAQAAGSGNRPGSAAVAGTTRSHLGLLEHHLADQHGPGSRVRRHGQVAGPVLRSPQAQEPGRCAGAGATGAPAAAQSQMSSP